MRTLLPALAVGAVSVFAQAALAADVGAPVYAPPPEPPFSWAGFYLGLNLGLDGARVSSQLQSTPLGNVTTLSGDFGGLLLGGQLGANWQFGSVVLGVEADLQATGGKKSNTTAVVGGNLTEDYTKGGLATLRGRAGWAFADGWLAYVTAGGALLTAKESFTLNGTNSTFNLTHGGWTAGLGIESAINRNWSWKLEYLYMQTGQFTTNVNFFGATVPWSTQLNDNVVRAGVNYRF